MALGSMFRPRCAIILGSDRLSLTDWQFVEVRDVPSGPWRNYGDNNNFVIARRQTEQRLAEQYLDQNEGQEVTHAICAPFNL